jgi:hypothetical protein
MKKIIFLFSFCIFVQNLWSQQMRFVIEKQPVIVKADNSNSVYLVDADNLITKYDQTGKKKGSFSFQKYGQITKLDVTSPFQTMVQYGNAGMVVFLDGNFEKVGELNLAQFGLTNAGALAFAPDKSGFYIYDAANNVINKYDIRGQNISEMGGFEMTKVDALFLNERKLFIQGNDKLVVTDILGQNSETYPSKNAKIVDFYQGKLVGKSTDGKLVEIIWQTGEIKPLSLPFQAELSDKIFVSQNYAFRIKDNVFLAY